MKFNPELYSKWHDITAPPIETNSDNIKEDYFDSVMDKPRTAQEIYRGYGKIIGYLGRKTGQRLHVDLWEALDFSMKG